MLGSPARPSLAAAAAAAAFVACPADEEEVCGHSTLPGWPRHRPAGVGRSVETPYPVCALGGDMDRREDSSQSHTALPRDAALTWESSPRSGRRRGPSQAPVLSSVTARPARGPSAGERLAARGAHALTLTEGHRSPIAKRESPAHLPMGDTPPPREDGPGCWVGPGAGAVGGGGSPLGRKVLETHGVDGGTTAHVPRARSLHYVVTTADSTPHVFCHNHEVLERGPRRCGLVPLSLGLCRCFTKHLRPTARPLPGGLTPASNLPRAAPRPPRDPPPTLALAQARLGVAAVGLRSMDRPPGTASVTPVPHSRVHFLLRSKINKILKKREKSQPSPQTIRALPSVTFLWVARSLSGVRVLASGV